MRLPTRYSFSSTGFWAVDVVSVVRGAGTSSDDNAAATGEITVHRRLSFRKKAAIVTDCGNY
jgi:hypothetical protein